jgi:AraC-like DNA-binding protein/mannose-6-phosphate isomerase-like protein (cupin superfamily)
MTHTHYYFESDKTKYESFLKHRPRLLYTGLLADVKNWFSEPSSHSFYEILYFYKGSGSIFTNGIEHHVKPGDLVIYSPGIMHKEETIEVNPFQFVFLAFETTNPIAGENNIFPALSTHSIISAGEYRYRLEDLFFQLLNEAKSHIDGYDVMCDNLLSSIIVQIIRIHAVIKHEEQSTSESQKIKDFIDKNYAKNLTLDTLSEIVYISKYHLAHIFKSEIGVPPITYLITKRMDKAKSLLSETNLTISAISKIIGYENPNYFSQLFKKIVGESPFNYRNNKHK